jgi:uncharacterized membrane protein
LLFWLSLFPLVTDWMGETHLARIPTAAYGVVLMMAAVAYWILQRSIISDQGCASVLARAIGSDIKGKISPVLYAIAIVLAFFWPAVSAAIYVAVALIWIVPDRRIERVIAAEL